MKHEFYNEIDKVIGEDLPDSSTPEEIATRIRRVRNLRDYADSYIMSIGKKFIPKFHWLDHKVSTFWTCADSPIGMCVFSRHLTDVGLTTGGCIYCHQPEERK